MNIVLFDFCETVIKIQTHDNFIGYYLWKKRKIKKFLKYKLYKNLFLRIIFRLLKVNIKYKLVKLLKNEKKEDIERLSEDYSHVLVKLQNKNVVNELVYHKEKNKIVIVSAGLSINIKHYLDLLGFSDIDVIANELMFEENNCTGNYTEADCFGSEKERRLNKKYSQSNFVACYTDSISDKPILDMCENQLIVEDNRDIYFISDSKFRESKKIKYKKSIWKIISKFFPDKWYLSYCYYRIHGKRLNWKSPKFLTEYIQIDKTNQKNKKNKNLVDKLKCREIINKKLGENYLPYLYDDFETVDTIDLKKYSNKDIVLKTNHDSSGAIIIKKNSFYCEEAIKNSLRNRLKNEHWRMTREYQYKGIKSRIIVEEMLTSNSKVPNDLKIHCFNGIPNFIYVSIDREGLNKRQIYDMEWNLLEFTWEPANKNLFEISKPLVEKPKNLQKLIEIASILSKDIRYCRIDLYNTDRGIVFGEITLHPHGGLEPIRPEKFDLKLGSLYGTS